MSEPADTDDARYDTRGPGHKRAGHPRLSSHTPVRFDPDTIAAIKQFSEEDGTTVSAWVRRVVNREVQRRISLRTRTASMQIVALSQEQGARTVTTTADRTVYFAGELRIAV